MVGDLAREDLVADEDDAGRLRHRRPGTRRASAAGELLLGRARRARARRGGRRWSWPWSWRRRACPRGPAASPRRRRSRGCGWPCPVGAMATIGWMAGMTWLTLPMSEEPRRSGTGSPSTSPRRLHVGGEEVEQDAGCASAARRPCRAGCTSSVAPVARGRALGAGHHALGRAPTSCRCAAPARRRSRRRTRG